MKHSVVRLQLSQFKSYLKPRPIDAYKGLFGHVWVVGGDEGFSGAVRMAGLAALRVGAGLVSVATRPEHTALMNLTCPEIMCHGVMSAKKLQPLLANATVIIVGPGLGQSSWGKKLFTEVLKSKKPCVVDADALNILAHQPVKNSDWILTPHPGEAARLLGKNSTEIQKNRLLAARKIQEKFDGVCVLKGAGSLIISSNEQPSECKAGNPGMATAGMGDILSGVIGGMVSQGMPLPIAAKLGVLVHAMAGDLAAKEGERGMIATDLLPYLRRLMNSK